MSSEPSDVELLLLDRYLDGVTASGRPPSDVASGTEVAVLAALIDRLALLPADEWPADGAVAHPPAGPPPVPLLTEGGRPARTRRRRATLVTGVAACAVAIALGLVGLALPPGRSGPGLSAAAWRLTGFVGTPSWVEASASATDLALTLDCPTTTTCLASDLADPTGTGAMARTTDGGGSWQGADLPAGTLLTSAPACTSAGTCLVGATTAQGAPAILRTTDGGVTFVPASLPPATGAVVSMACSGTALCVAAVTGTAGSSVLTSLDGGVSWVADPLPPGFTPSGPSAAGCPGPDACAIGGQVGGAATVARTGDDGGTWSLETVPGQVVDALSCTGDGFCAAIDEAGPGPAGVQGTSAGDSGVAVSVDGGATFVAAAAQGLPASILRAVSCPATGSCWVTGNEAAPGELRPLIAATSDSGASFATEPLPGAPDVTTVRSVSCPSVAACIALAPRQAPGQTSAPVAVLSRTA